MSAHGTRAPVREEVVRATTRAMPRAFFLVSGVLAVLGALLFMAGAVMGEPRAWRALHVNWLYFSVLSSAGVMFVAVQRITTARWSRPVIRFAEGYVAFLPVAFLLLLLIVLVGQHHIFTWTQFTPYNHERQVYFDPVFFTVRVLGVFGLITLLSLWFVYTSVRLDVAVAPESGWRWARGLRARMRRGFREERREIHSTHSRQGTLAVLLALAFGFGWCFLAFDLSMSLDLYFFSTLYGWWFFMGGWLGALMLFALITMWWRRHLNAYDIIQESHFHDIGKLCFAFTAFWGYLTFGQYLIIWYANLDDETGFMNLRLSAPWMGLTLAVIFTVFVIPFFGLLSRAAKVFLPTLAGFAILSLLGIWLLRYMEVYPSLYGATHGIPFGLWEIGATCFVAGLWGLSYGSFMEAFPRMRVMLMTSPFRDEVQVPVDPETMEPLPAHE